VLDSNTVFDWLLFRHPDGLAIGAAVAAGRLRWLATAAMRDELMHVLARGGFERWQPDPVAIVADWARHCVEMPTPSLADPTARFRCTDADDQKFIDLALSTQARWLLTRDRAVLKLAKRLREVGTEVLTPAAWAALHAGSAG
jgi:predicted nucleic acid-binding protein